MIADPLVTAIVVVVLAAALSLLVLAVQDQRRAKRFWDEIDKDIEQRYRREMDGDQ